VFDQKVYDRLMARTLKDESGCWLWTGPVRTSKWAANRYGHFAVYRDGKRVEQYTHRGMWFALHGEPPAGMCVCHKCDNPKCVNPEHLWLGTNRENTMDMVRKKRHHLNRKTHCKRGHLLSGANLYIQPKDGYRACKACSRLRNRESWRKDPAKHLEGQRRRRLLAKARLGINTGTDV
jgi:hypothetical protein